MRECCFCSLSVIARGKFSKHKYRYIFVIFFYVQLSILLFEKLEHIRKCGWKTRGYLSMLESQELIITQVKEGS